MKIKNKNKMSKKQILSVMTLVTTLLAHIIAIIFVIMSYKYYGIEIKTFIGIIGVIVSLLIIVDILFVVGYNFKDHKIKVILCFLSSVMLVCGVGGTLLVGKINTTVNKITSNNGTDQFEQIGVNFVTYDNNKINELDDLNRAKVGVVSSEGNGVTSLGKNKLEQEQISAKYVEFDTLNDLFLGLLNGDVECAILQTGYKSVLGTNEDYKEYIEKLKEIYSFSENVKTGENASANKDLSVEPFNILLIGFAPEEGGGGLADSIILATVNPQTLTVTLTSVPRDSYVPIACYPGQSKDKITHSRAYGRECLMNTVGNLFDIDVDLYMEINFQGLADVVDAVGGIWIDSPVEFVGQTPSSKRGEFTVWVGKGGQMANGEQALAFARERHAMPNGDLDRAIHQQEVIEQIAGKLINLRDVSKALKVLDAAGNNFSTNLSINQLTSIFNYIISAPNNGGLSKMNTIDIQSMRLAGYDSRSYHMGMQLPIYVFPLYKGSIKQCYDRINQTMGNYDAIEQDDYFKFFAEYPYSRGTLYDEYFDEPQIHEELPGFVLNFVAKGLTLSDAQEWAAEYGVNLDVVYIQEDDPRYVEGQNGLIVDMSERYGILVSNIANNTLKIWVCGELDPADQIPNFIGRPLAEAQIWCEQNGYKLVTEIISKDSDDFVAEKAGLIYDQSIKAGINKNNYSEITIKAYENVKNKVDYSSLKYGVATEEDIWLWAKNNGITGHIEINPCPKTAEIPYQVGTLLKEPTFSNPDGSKGGPYQDSSFIFTIVSEPEDTVDPEKPETDPGTEPETVIEINEDYVGKKESDFNAYLQGLGLKGNATKAYSEEVAEGNIISIATGKYHVGDGVNFVVSMGKKEETD